MNRIIFWQQAPSPHQAPFIRALAARRSLDSTIGVFQGTLHPNRVALGWSQPDYGTAKVLINPSQTIVDELVADDTSNTVHIFSGLIYSREARAIFKRCQQTRAMIGILSEGRDWRGWAGAMRRLHSAFCERRDVSAVKFVLAMGHVGVRWWQSCGYADDRVFEYCYGVERPPVIDISPSTENSARLVFVGQLIRRKRVDLLLTALARLKPLPWSLRIIGDGVEKCLIEALVKKLGLSDRVEFMGVLDNVATRRELANGDLLVLPSRWDGWGAVVNEALMSGARVLCSDYCGAAVLVRGTPYGNTFVCDSETSLASALSHWIALGPLTAVERLQIQSWSRCIDGDNLAEYMLAVVNYAGNHGTSRPSPPWRNYALSIPSQS